MEPFSLNALSSNYENKPIIRALIQLIPFGIGSAVDVGAITYIQSLRSDRLRVFFNELNNGEIDLNEEVIHNNDFLHCYFVATSAALRSRRSEKIRLFARLFRSAIIESKISDLDDFEYFTEILLELSFKEILILTILERLEHETPIQENENELQRASRFWNIFIKEVEEKLNIKQQELNPILTRISRTGCYEEFVGGYWDYTGGTGKTTVLFQKLKSLVLSQHDL